MQFQIFSSEMKFTPPPLYAVYPYNPFILPSHSVVQYAINPTLLPLSPSPPPRFGIYFLEFKSVLEREECVTSTYIEIFHFPFSRLFIFR